MGMYSTHCICSCKFTTITEWQRLVDKMAVWPVCPRPPPSLAQRVPHPPLSGSENAPPTCFLAQRVSHPPASLLRECPTHMFPGSESVPPTWLLAQRASHPPVSWLRECPAPTCFLAQGVPHPPVSWHRECPSHLFPGSESGLSTRC